MLADADDDGDGALDFEDPFPLDKDTKEAKNIPNSIGLIK
jgi:hypothetical protein